MKKDWKPLTESVAYKDGVLQVRRKDYFYDKVNDSMTFTVVDISDWAVIVPKTVDGDFIIVRQFRVGFERDTLEFPGGSINRNENPADASTRELAEETGAIPQEMTLLGVMEPNPAFMSNKCHVFLAEGCEFTSTMTPDKFEDTEALTVSETQLRQMIKNGEFSQSISLAAFGLYLNHASTSRNL